MVFSFKKGKNHESRQICLLSTYRFSSQTCFDCIVDKYDGNKHVKFFTCWNQLCSMIFGQLAGRESMRDLMIGLEAHKSKFYHLGFERM